MITEQKTAEVQKLLLKKIVGNQFIEGDYVIIQFGHNDESKTKVDRYANPEEFKENLTKFINETRAKKAIPILVTPVSRRNFDSLGIIKETHKEYTALTKAVAEKTGVVLIDLDEKSRQLYQSFGAENSKLLFLQLAPNEHPNYPKGKEDNTHFNELGARKIAQIMLAEIKTQFPDIASRIVVSKNK